MPSVVRVAKYTSSEFLVVMRTHSEDTSFRSLQIQRDWVTSPYMGRQDPSKFASSQIWQLIDIERQKTGKQDWSLDVQDVGSGSHTEYTENRR